MDHPPQLVWPPWLNLSWYDKFYGPVVMSAVCDPTTWDYEPGTEVYDLGPDPWSKSLRAIEQQEASQ